MGLGRGRQSSQETQNYQVALRDITDGVSQYRDMGIRDKRMLLTVDR